MARECSCKYRRGISRKSSNFGTLRHGRNGIMSLRRGQRAMVVVVSVRCPPVYGLIVVWLSRVTDVEAGRAGVGGSTTVVQAGSNAATMVRRRYLVMICVMVGEHNPLVPGQLGLHAPRQAPDREGHSRRRAFRPPFAGLCRAICTGGNVCVAACVVLEKWNAAADSQARPDGAFL